MFALLSTLAVTSQNSEAQNAASGCAATQKGVLTLHMAETIDKASPRGYLTCISINLFT